MWEGTESGYLVAAARQTDGERLVEEYGQLVPALQAAIEFVGTDDENDWILIGTDLDWIEESARLASNPAGREQLRKEGHRLYDFNRPEESDP